MLSKATGDKPPTGTNPRGNSCEKTCKDSHENRQRTRQHMLECEAREWLRRGHNDRAGIRILRNSIARRRGDAAADKLINEMRRQWRLRSNK